MSPGVSDVVGSIRAKGVRLWSENGQLRYKAPKGALTSEEMTKLRTFRPQIVALLEDASRADFAATMPAASARLDCVPLTCSQLAHWHLYRLGERPGMRQLATAVRMSGRLNLDALRSSVATVVRRHDVLRTRIIVCDGVPMQQVGDSGNAELRVHDLTMWPDSLQESRVNTLIEGLMLEPLDVTVGPLFSSGIIRLGQDEHVFFFAMEHLISDALSMYILLRDVFVTYAQTVQRQPLSLPDIEVQFSDFATWQHNSRPSWVAEHGVYWRERLAGCERVRFPDALRSTTDSDPGWGTVPIHIGGDLKAELQEWCRQRRTTLAMTVFTACVGLVMRWCDVSDAVFQYETTGRAVPEVEHTIGYFAAALCMRIELLDGDRLIDLLHRVTEEYCRAHEHADAAYIESRVPRPEVARNCFFNWVPQGAAADLSDLDGTADALTCRPVPIGYPTLKHVARDNEPFILLFDGDAAIDGDVCFPLGRFEVATMERFARNLLMFIRTLLKQPEQRVGSISLLQ